MSDAFAFAFGIFVLFACSIEWAENPETYSHPDNFPYPLEITE